MCPKATKTALNIKIKTTVSARRFITNYINNHKIDKPLEEGTILGGT